MKATPAQEVTKTYRRSIPNTWWLKKRSYLLFMVREFSAFFVALYAILLLIQLYALSRGREIYGTWIEVFQSGWMILLHFVIWLFVLYHMVTWFKISGRIFGERPLSPGAVTAVNYIVWIILSIGIAYFTLRG